MTAALIIAAQPAPCPEGFMPTTQVGSISALQRLIIVFQEVGIERIVIAGLTGQEELEHHVARMGVICLYGERSGDLLQTCLQTSCDYLVGKCDRTLIAWADMPLFSPETVQTLLQSKATLAAPVYKGNPGGLLLASIEQLHEMCESTLPQAENINFLAGWTRQAAHIPVEDKGLPINLSAEPDWESKMLDYRLNTLRPQMKLLVAREESFLGPGMVQLLSILDETGSMRIACEQMSISYSKGWKLVNTIEQQVGFAVVIRQKGGRTGGYSHLSDRGRNLMQRYQAYAAECRAAIQPIFAKYFGGSQWTGKEEEHG